MRHHRLRPCLLALMCLMGCVVEPSVDQLVVTVTVSEPEIRAGDTTTITVRATNPTNGPVDFSTNSCVLVALILDETGEEVYPGGGPCLDILLTHSVPPGEFLEEVFDFDGRGRRGWRDQGERYLLPPGTYQVRGAVGSERRNLSRPVPLQVRSDG